VKPEDEASLLSPYHGARDFSVGVIGAVRGLHFLQLPQDGEVYSSRLEIEGELPRLLVRRNRPGEEPPGSIFGPLAYTEDPDLDLSFLIYSEGEGFAHRLLTREEVKEALTDVGTNLQRIEIAPHGDGSQLMVDVKTWGDSAVVHRAVDLSLALVEAADELAGEDHRYENAWELHEQPGPAEVDASALEELKRRTTASTTWVQGQVERSGNALLVHLSLSDGYVGHEPLHGTMHVRWRDEAATSVDVELTGSLAEHVGEHAELTRERGGIRGFLARIGETELGDEPLDKAYVIDAEPGAKPLLLRARDPLVALGHFDTRVTLETTRLKTITRHVTSSEHTLEDVLEQTLQLWRAAALYRAGFDVVLKDPFQATPSPENESAD
jgi:hypothetical protein